jgi:hypothetical protein
MTRRIGMNSVIVLIALSCQPGSIIRPQSPQKEMRVTAANNLTGVYARSRMSAWKVRAQARGTDCAILFVETPIILEESMVDALHYGAGKYDIYNGGVQQFCRDRSFRGVAYKDGSGRVWAYGALSQHEAETAAPCH